MASIREIARRELETARDGIGFIVLWKQGRSWNSTTVYPLYDAENGTFTFENAEDIDELRKIAEIDDSAIIVNSYYDNLGMVDELTAEVLANALRWQYEEHGTQLADALQAEVEQTADQEATENVEQKTTVESKIFKFFFADYKTFEAGDKNSGLQVNPAIEQGSQRYVKIVFGDILGGAYDYQLNTAGITPNEIREACAENLLKHEECNSWQARKKGQTHLYYITKKGIKALYNAYKGQW